MLAYLIHLNSPKKHQYEAKEVNTNIDDYQQLMLNYAVKKTKEKKSRLAVEREKIQNIITDISIGKIREFDISNNIDVNMYAKYSRQIKSAFEYRRNMLLSEDRKMNVLYLYGSSGTGKTTYAKDLAKSKGMSYYVSSSSNDVLDGYKGEDVIILDDLRPDSFELSDLLKFLDNNTSTSVKSRYHNKIIEASYIIITSIYSIDDFFKKIDKHTDEPIEQLKRRCKFVARFDAKNIWTYFFNDLTMEEEFIEKMPNTIAKNFLTKSQKEDEKEKLTIFFKNSNNSKSEFVEFNTGKEEP